MWESWKEVIFTYLLCMRLYWWKLENTSPISIELWSLREQEMLLKHKPCTWVFPQLFRSSPKLTVLCQLLSIGSCDYYSTCICETLQDAETSGFFCEPGTFSFLNCETDTSSVIIGSTSHSDSKMFRLL